MIKSVDPPGRQSYAGGKSMQHIPERAIRQNLNL
jgi:hypothetical protein